MAHLMKNAVWFGTENDMRWVPAPAANYSKTKARWRAVDQYLHGGAGVRKAPVSNKTLSLVWPVQSQESLAPLVRYLEEDGPFYYLDPLDAQSNALPSYWAEPVLSLEHGPDLVGGMTPTAVATSTGKSLGYPTQGLSYTFSGAKASKVFIPVPEGHALHLGVHGSGTAKVTVGAVQAPFLALTTSTRTNAVVTGPTIANIGFTAGTATISGIVAQVLPTGQAPISGGFLPGLGHTQLELANDPTITSYSANLPNAQTGIAADFVEVGAWL